MKKSLIAILTAMAILTAYFSPCVIASEDATDDNSEEALEEMYTPNIYDDTVPHLFSNDNRVIELYTAEDLFALREAIQANDYYTFGKTIELMQDIDLNGAEWLPMGYNEDTNTALHTFRGIFNGNGHSISNFTITSTEYDTVGFIADAYGASFNNLTVSNAVIDIQQVNEASVYTTNAALLCASALDTAFNECNVSGTIKLVSDMNDEATRLQIGMLSGCSIASVANSYTEGIIDVTLDNTSYIGGIIGCHQAFENKEKSYIIENCISNVNIDVKSNIYENSAYIGGISGGSQMADNFVIRGCQYGTDADTYINGNGFNAMNAGGITTSTYGEIVDCTTAADISISCKDGYARGGGITVWNYGTVKNCHSSAHISVTPDSSRSAYAAGIACLNGKSCDKQSSAAQLDEEHLIENCTFDEEGSIYVSSNATNSIGGITAYAYPTSHIKRCYSASSNFDFGKSAALYLSPIVGNAQGSIIEQSSASGTLKPSGTVTSTLYIGGIVGDLTCRSYYRYNEYGEAEAVIDGGIVESCLADINIDVKARAIHAGGIAGYVYGNALCTGQQPTVRSSKFSGSISISPTSTSFAGGVTGYVVDGTVENCYSVCEIAEAALSATTAQIFIGGCVARLKQQNATVSTPLSHVRNCYTDANIISSGNASKTLYGTFTSEVSANGVGLYPVISNCYYVQGDKFDNDTAIPISQEQLTLRDSFNDWDFNNEWYMSDIQPKLFFEQPAILGYDCDRDVNSAVTQVNSIDISSLIGSNTLYIVAYDSGIPVCIRAFKLKDNKNVFLNIDCNMPIPYSADKIKIFTWTDDMTPLLDTHEIPISSWQ